MKPQTLNDPFHNPFFNRFQDPVTRRHDDMQSHEYTRWLSERSRAMSLPMPVIPKARNVPADAETNHGHRTLAGMLVLFVVLISAALLLKPW